MNPLVYMKSPLEKEARRLLYGRCRFDEPLAAMVARKASSNFIPERGVVL